MADDFLTRCRSLVRELEGKGWQLTEERSIPYGRMHKIVRGPEAATLSCYHGKRGFRVVAAGKGADALRTDLGQAAPTATASGPKGGNDPFGLGWPRIGADESGKGDWFGPLVVAAWYATEDDAPRLRALGIQDSKRLEDRTILRAAGALDEIGHGEVRVLMPVDYNERYAEVGNLNVLLAQEHARCINALRARAKKAGWVPAPVVFIDRFASSDRGLLGALRLPTGVRLQTAPRAEADPAVAAASILARAAFVEALRALQYEMGASLHPGAGAPVLRDGRALVASHGREVLPQVAKMHFATTRQVVGS